MRLDWPEKWNVVVGKTLSLAETLNETFVQNPKEKQYGFLADDTMPSPFDWAQRLQTVAGNDYIAYPDDCVHGEKLCTHHCIGGDLMRKVGYWCIPVKHNFFDTAWFLIGSHTNRLKYVPEVKFEHQHPLKGFESDETYKIGESHFEKDQKAFNNWAETELPKISGQLNPTLARENAL